MVVVEEEEAADGVARLPVAVVYEGKEGWDAGVAVQKAGEVDGGGGDSSTEEEEEDEEEEGAGEVQEEEGSSSSSSGSSSESNPDGITSKKIFFDCWCLLGLFCSLPVLNLAETILSLPLSGYVFFFLFHNY